MNEKGVGKASAPGGNCSCDFHDRSRPCSAPRSHFSPDPTTFLYILVPAPMCWVTAPNLARDRVKQGVAFSLDECCHCKRGQIHQEAGLGLHPLLTRSLVGQSHVLVSLLLKTLQFC